MAASNELVNVEKIWNALGKPALTSHEAADAFTSVVTATLHFGSSILGITGNPNWGRRRNPSGILSDDVAQYKETGENFDIILGAGGPNARIGWDTSTPGPWVAPKLEDVLGGIGGNNPPINRDGVPNPPIDLSKIEIALRDLNARLTNIESILSGPIGHIKLDAEGKLIGSSDDRIEDIWKRLVDAQKALNDLPEQLRVIFIEEARKIRPRLFITNTETGSMVAKLRTTEISVEDN